jgi:hypothetical protein
VLSHPVALPAYEASSFAFVFETLITLLISFQTFSFPNPLSSMVSALLSVCSLSSDLRRDRDRDRDRDRERERSSRRRRSRSGYDLNCFDCLVSYS